ncbi:MAG: hypothetical protein Q7R30_10860 [Acidobacteriota bacterium]|nr:hypothetical protein [Acidobacteriota bacterium]
MRLPIIVRVIVLASLVWVFDEYSLQAQPKSTAKFDIAELWQDPADLLQRDLYAGPGGAELAPPRDKPFQFVAHKTTGVNPGYDVKDPTGRAWSVKLGVEAQSEVTASRILWAMGFHQPANYYLEQWTLEGVDAGVKSDARFRTDTDAYKPGAEWSWSDNLFVNTQAFRGLIATQMILNSWDLKTANNRVYEATDPSASPRRLFMVRDVGSSLGHSKQGRFFAMIGTPGSQGSKNDLEGFERQGFIKKVNGNRVAFDYRGMYGQLLNRVTPADVVWTCELLARLPDTHWQAAFRAGEYTPDQTDRYVRKIKEKIAQGLALKTAGTR